MDIEIVLKNYRCFSDSEPARFLIKNGFIAFVGINNSGKSSLLKFFYEFRALFGLLNRSGNLINALVKRENFFGFPDSVRDPDEVFCNLNQNNIFIEIIFREINDDNPDPNITKIKKIIIEFERSPHKWWSAKIENRNGLVKFKGVLEFGDDNCLKERAVPKLDFTDLFDAAKKLHNMIYIGSFRNAINLGASDSYFDIQVGQAFVTKWRAYKNGFNKKENEAAREVTKSIERVFGFDDLEINASEEGSMLQVFIGDKSYKLSEVGAGLAQFILVLVTAAVKRPSFILIDEPELNLHPSLQLDFLTTIASYASEGVIFSTHSIGLARSSAEFVYTVQRDKNTGKSRVLSYETVPRLSEFLGELSFSGYQDLGFNKILLVEGVTEVKAIQQLLRKWKKEHEIVLVSLGGSQFINGRREAELEELKRISNNVHALIDSEKISASAHLSSDRKGFIEICGQLKINCHVLERRALENYWTDRVVKMVKGDKYAALNEYGLLKEAPQSWGKSENWRLAKEMKKVEIESTDLGKFISSL